MGLCGGRWSGFGRMGMSKRPSAVSHQPSGKAFGTDRQAQGQGARVAIIAAMEREVAPLIRGWKVRELTCDGRRYRLFESGDTVLICGGIGAQAARRAAEAVIRETEPARVVSVGFAGALDSKMKVADVMEPRVVVNSADGARADTGSGQGTLVSYSGVADQNQKQRLARSYAADAVDMEAAAVAQAAQAHEIEFGALKAISDVVDFAMPPTERFVSSDGELRTASFVLHVAVRPWLWGSTIALARNSARASRALCAAIESYLERESQDLRRCVSPMNPPKESLGGAPSV
jgi:adenosylhomocysteine nucleosidase